MNIIGLLNCVRELVVYEEKIKVLISDLDSLHT